MAEERWVPKQIWPLPTPELKPLSEEERFDFPAKPLDAPISSEEYSAALRIYEEEYYKRNPDYKPDPWTPWHRIPRIPLSVRDRVVADIVKRERAKKTKTEG